MKSFILLALPIIFANLLSTASNLISMYFIAQLDVSALAAGAIITSSFGLFMMVSISLLYSVSILVGRHFGAANVHEIGKIVCSGLVLAFMLGVVFVIIMLNMEVILTFLHQPDTVRYKVSVYFKGVAWGFIPCLLSAVLSQFFMGISKPRLILSFSTLSVILNAWLGYSLIFGVNGLPSFGMYGAGLAYSLAAWVVLLWQILYLRYSSSFKRHLLWSYASLSLQYLKPLFLLGFPISVQYSIELFAFAILTYLIGTLGTIALAAQQISLQLAMFSIMVSVGLSQAAAILTSQAFGKGAFQQIKDITSQALWLGFFSTFCISFLFVVKPLWCIGFYLNIDDVKAPQTIQLATSLLWITAITQLFDAERTICTGLLRGLGNTKLAMQVSIHAFWFLGLSLTLLFGMLYPNALSMRLGMMIGVIYGFIALFKAVFKRLRLSSASPEFKPSPV